MEIIVSLSIVISCLSYTETQLTVPGSFISTSGTIQPPSSLAGPFVSIPPSLQETFTTAYINDLKSWADFDKVFNVPTEPDNIAVEHFYLIFDRAIKSGMKPERAWIDAIAVSRAIKDTIAYLTPQTLPKILGYIYFDQLAYGKVINAANVFSLAQSLSDVYKDIFSKPVISMFHGIFDASEKFLTPFNLYNAEGLMVKDANVVKYLYLVTVVPWPVQ